MRETWTTVGTTLRDGIFMLMRRFGNLPERGPRRPAVPLRSALARAAPALAARQPPRSSWLASRIPFSPLKKRLEPRVLEAIHNAPPTIDRLLIYCQSTTTICNTSQQHHYRKHNGWRKRMSSDSASRLVCLTRNERAWADQIFLQGAKAAQKRERNQKNAAGAAKSQLKAVRLSRGLDRGKEFRG